MTIFPADKTRFTPDDLLHMADAVNYELVDGQLVERNVSVESSRIASRIAFLLNLEAERERSASIFPSDLAYQCFADAPDKVRRPDVSLVKTERMASVPNDAGYMPIIPDLAVEVVSPNDLSYDVEEKVQEYLAAAFLLIWVVHPNTRTVTIHRADRSTASLNAEQEISGETALPTFRCRVSEFFRI